MKVKLNDKNIDYLRDMPVNSISIKDTRKLKTDVKIQLTANLGQKRKLVIAAVFFEKESYTEKLRDKNIKAVIDDLSANELKRNLELAVAGRRAALSERRQKDKGVTPRDIIDYYLDHKREYSSEDTVNTAKKDFDTWIHYKSDFLNMDIGLLMDRYKKSKRDPKRAESCSSREA